MGVGCYIESSWFTVGGHYWCLHYYPDGSTEDGKDDIVVALELMELDQKAFKARVSFTISLFHCTTKRFSLSLSVALSANLPNPDYFVTHNINRGEMEASGYVVDDRLTIKCALTVIKEPYVIEEEAHVEEEAPPSEIMDQLGKLLEAKEGVDVTLEVQGVKFPAHKLVLAMRSPVFKAMLYGPMMEKDSSRIAINNMQPDVFKFLLHFIYNNSLPAVMGDDLLDEDNKREVTRHLLVAADHYGMERLKLMCESILCKDLNAESLATTLALASQHSCSRLQDACIRFIASSSTKIDDVVASKGYNRLKRTCPDTVTEMWEKASRLCKT
ncbi:BTB/POZ and MATH domain-containing protein 2-like [Triticum urartu]|uniref:BTB/POZ and MATH domain-containing protein 2-like n=1 Tax=Triticum urartu TaxID=4572 RepID=UPI00204380F0|nr:BTB/POZ and MATH domain-containing protein 2-like [Triticum urartu]XP_048556252.1 BTB/POZ and MATH domain-containing protein 2-like [Triticum urartu]